MNGRSGSRRILVVANDHVGSRMAGPGIRSYRFADELARDHDVTLVVPFPTDLETNRFTVVHDDPWDAARMTRLARGFDAIVAQRLPIPTMLKLAGGPTRTIYDLYAPWPIEALAFDSRERATPLGPISYRLNTFSHDVALATGTAFVCASEKQRDLWLGSLLAAGRVDHASYADDPSLRRLIDVVPFGIETDPPAPAAVLRGVVPGIGDEDRVLLWPGGIWNWLDPLTPIEAVAELSRHRDDVRLYFLGLEHPNPEVPAMAMAARALARADELRVRDRSVFFNFGWVPYAERGAYLLEADVGVSAHFDDLESRFAFRTRLVDCFWAGLPVVTSAGDALADLVARERLGHVIAVGDVRGWVDALTTLLDDQALGPELDERLRAVRDELAWPRVVEPLRRLVAADGPPAPVARRSGVVPRYLVLRLQYAFALRGYAGAARRVLEKGVRRTRSRPAARAAASR